MPRQAEGISKDGQRAPKAPQRETKGAKGIPKGDKGSPRAPDKGTPKGDKGSQRHPSCPQGVPQVLRDGKVEPKAIPKGAKGSSRTFQSKPKEPQRHPREASRALYIYTLPINRPSVRYVIHVCKYLGMMAPFVLLGRECRQLC